MQAELQSLLALQEKDIAVMDVQRQLDALNPEIAALDGALAALDMEVARAEQRVADVTERRMGLESKIESYRVMQDRRRQKLEWVRGAKEAATLMAEIDLARSVLAKEESDWIRSSDAVQDAEKAVVEVRERAAACREEQAARRSEIDALQGEFGGQLKKALSRRLVTTKSVTRPLLVRYERIRKGRAPLALYPLHGGACGHCFTAIPMHLRQQLGQSEGTETCEACGVLMYLTPTDGP